MAGWLISRVGVLAWSGSTWKTISSKLIERESAPELRRALDRLPDERRRRDTALTGCHVPGTGGINNETSSGPFGNASAVNEYVW